MPNFTVILVHPEHPHNIGFVARSMRSNGLSDLRIVYKRPALPKNCWQTAHSSADILDNARIETSLENALADCSFSVGFSRRIFGTILPHVSLPELPPLCKDKNGNVALVFGRESSGLSFEELTLCAVQCEIPVAGQMSINISHAVSVASYELCRSGLLGEGLASRNKPSISHRKPATIEQIDVLASFIDENLTEKYKIYGWAKTSVRYWLQKLNPTQAEFAALFGMFRALTGKPARTSDNSNSESGV